MSLARISTVIFLICCWIPVTQAQTMLTLFRKNKDIATYRTGDNIRFKLTGEDFFYEKRITGFGPNKIYFRYFDLSLDEIEIVHLREGRKNALNVYAGLAIRGGIIFLAADFVNQGIIRDEGFQLSDGTWIIGGGLIGSSLLIYFLKKRKFNVKRQKYRLAIR